MLPAILFPIFFSAQGSHRLHLNGRCKPALYIGTNVSGPGSFYFLYKNILKETAGYFCMETSMQNISQHHHCITYYSCSYIADPMLLIACVTKPQVHQHSIDCGILSERNTLPNDMVGEEWQQG